MTAEEYGRKFPALPPPRCVPCSSLLHVLGGSSSGISNEADVQGGASAKEKKG